MSKWLDGRPGLGEHSTKYFIKLSVPTCKNPMIEVGRKVCGLKNLQDDGKVVAFLFPLALVLMNLALNKGNLKRLQ